MTKIWHDTAWEDYLYWQTQDKKTLKRINRLLKDIERNGYNCVGKPEPLMQLSMSERLKDLYRNSMKSYKNQ